MCNKAKNNNYYYYTLRFLLSVCLCVTDVGVAVTNLRVVCQTITCVSAFTEIAILLLFFLEMIVEAAAGLDTLRCRLREGCHCGRLPSHYRRARTQDYLACLTRTRHYFSLTCHSVQRARQSLLRRAISVGSYGGPLVSKFKTSVCLFKITKVIQDDQKINSRLQSHSR